MRKKVIVSMVFLLMSVSIVGCGHTHTLTAAICTTPSVCTECGEQVGTLISHSFTTPTCTNPATCVVCGITSGSTSEHTTEFGKCATCGVFQGKDIVDAIADEYDTIFYKSEALFAKLNYVTDYYSTLTSIADGYKELEKNYQNMIDMCGDYSELSTLKSACRDAKNALPTRVSGSSQKELENYLDDLKDYAYEELDVGLEVESAKKKCK